jgi:hypothetical protein
MSAPKHTPGPWSLTADQFAHIVTDVEGNEIYVGTNEEDARLIIIEGTRLDNFDNRNDDVMLSWNGGYNFTKRIKAARAAIAKATGEKA